MFFGKEFISVTKTEDEDWDVRDGNWLDVILVRWLRLSGDVLLLLLLVTGSECGDLRDDHGLLRVRRGSHVR